MSEEFVRRAGARMIDLQGIGHLIPLEVPEDFTGIVRDFVSEVSVSS